MIKQLREGKGLTQEELAQMADISVRTLQRVERGETPSLETSRALAAALDVSLAVIKGDSAMTDHPPRDAVKHVKKLRGFYGHLAQYVLIILLLWAINLWNSPSFLWAIFPTLGWGIGLLFHAVAVFDWWPQRLRGLRSQWEKREIERFLNKQKTKP